MASHSSIWDNTAHPPTADYITAWNSLNQPMAYHRTILNNAAQLHEDNNRIALNNRTHLPIADHSNQTTQLIHNLLSCRETYMFRCLWTLTPCLAEWKFWVTVCERMVLTDISVHFQTKLLGKTDPWDMQLPVCTCCFYHTLKPNKDTICEWK
jgi:hypothetical protein